MTKMIINADDFGYSRGVNYGILDAYLEGVLTSATLMVNQPGAEHGAELAKKYPGLGVGLHLNISLGKPLTGGKTLTGGDGTFIKPAEVLEKGHEYDGEELFAELEAQYREYLKLVGHPPTHIDSHLFSTDKLETMARAAKDLALKYGIPLRNHDLPGRKHVEFITFRTFDQPAGLDYLKDHFAEICRHEYVEIMSHPAYLDSDVLEKSSYNVQRCKELDILCSSWLKQLIEEYRVERISYRDV